MRRLKRAKTDLQPVEIGKSHKWTNLKIDIDKVVQAEMDGCHRDGRRS